MLTGLHSYKEFSTHSKTSSLLPQVLTRPSPSPLVLQLRPQLTTMSWPGMDTHRLATLTLSPLLLLLLLLLRAVQYRYRSVLLTSTQPLPWTRHQVTKRSLVSGMKLQPTSTPPIITINTNQQSLLLLTLTPALSDQPTSTRSSMRYSLSSAQTQETRTAKLTSSSQRL